MGRKTVALACLAALLSGCGDSETTRLQKLVDSHSAEINDLRMQMARFCIDSTPSGDVVTPCPRGAAPPVRTGFYQPPPSYSRY